MLSTLSRVENKDINISAKMLTLVQMWTEMWPEIHRKWEKKRSWHAKTEIVLVTLWKIPCDLSVEIIIQQNEIFHESITNDIIKYLYH